MSLYKNGKLSLNVKIKFEITTFYTLFTFGNRFAKKKECNESTLLKPFAKTVINFQKIKEETVRKLVASLLDKAKPGKKYVIADCCPRIHFY